MRGNIFFHRNKAIKKRFEELKEQGRNNAQCWDKMAWEFWLEPRTIRDIVYNKYSNRTQSPNSANQMSIF